MSERKAVIKNADMSEEMQQDAVDCATQALEKYNIEKVCLYVEMMFGCSFVFPLTFSHF
jgi:dynein light chain LC8-type